MIFASGQYLVEAMWLVGLIVIVTLVSLSIGIGLSITRAHRSLGNRILKVAILVAALEFGAVLFGFFVL
jgi:hypothetical protein